MFEYNSRASKSDFADLLTEYVKAERIGQGTHGPGECFPYYKDCPRSIFKTQNHKYRCAYFFFFKYFFARIRQKEEHNFFNLIHEKLTPNT